MIFTVYFSKSGIFETGLSPTITIKEAVVSAPDEVTDATMYEVGLGFYGYNFTTSDNAKNYVALAESDDVDMIGSEKYAPGISTTQGDIEFIRAIEGGRWHIDTVAHTMTFYAEDNVTQVAVFALTEEAVVQYSQRVRT